MLPTSHETNPPPRWVRCLLQTEDTAVALVLAAIVLLPVTEIVLRWFNSGLAASTDLVKHATLTLGMLGGALAARQNRLLALSSLPNLFPVRWKTCATVFSHSVAAAISFYLSTSALKFSLTEREAGKILAYGLPVWVVQLILPIGFGLVAARLIWHAAPHWRGRIAAVSILAILVATITWSQLPPEKLLWPALTALLLATLLGAPIFTTLGGAALILFWTGGTTVLSIPVKHYSFTTHETLPTIPLFTLAGYFFAEGGAAKRLIRVFQAWTAQVRGGPAVVTVLVCAFFTAFTGASGVTILALGGLLFPVLLAAGYNEKNALGLLTSSGSLGLLFPPCLPVILYAIIASGVVTDLSLDNSQVSTVTMEKMFLGGVAPGILLIALTGAWGIWVGPKNDPQSRAFDFKEARAALWDAKWELLLPLLALGTLFSGRATAVEAAAVTAFYAFFVETFVYRDLRLFKDVPRVMAECGLLVGGVLLILGVAMGFTNYLVTEEIPSRGVEWVQRTIHQPWTFLLVLNLFLLVVGCLMDIFSAIVVVVPLIVPMGVAFGIDPIHLGIVFLVNLELGYLTPPVGMNLFLSSYRFHKPMGEVVRSVLPLLLVRTAAVLLVTYTPAISTTLPRLLEKPPPAHSPAYVRRHACSKTVLHLNNSSWLVLRLPKPSSI